MPLGTDPETNVTTYTYDTSNQLATIRDGRNVVYLTNVYTNGRVTQQTLADPTNEPIQPSLAYGESFQVAVSGMAAPPATGISAPAGGSR